MSGVKTQILVAQLFLEPRQVWIAVLGSLWCPVVGCVVGYNFMLGTFFFI